jgi:hypothetical protein
MCVCVRVFSHQPGVEEVSPTPLVCLLARAHTHTYSHTHTRTHTHTCISMHLYVYIRERASGSEHESELCRGPMRHAMILIDLSCVWLVCDVMCRVCALYVMSCVVGM